MKKDAQIYIVGAVILLFIAATVLSGCSTTKQSLTSRKQMPCWVKK